MDTWHEITMKRKFIFISSDPIEDCFGVIQCNPTGEISNPIKASCNPLVHNNQGTVHFVFQNINNISLRKGIQAMLEVATITILQLLFWWVNQN